MGFSLPCLASSRMRRGGPASDSRAPCWSSRCCSPPPPPHRRRPRRPWSAISARRHSGQTASWNISEANDTVAAQQFTTGSSTYVVTAAQVDVHSTILTHTNPSVLNLRICPRGTGNFPDLDNCLGTLSGPSTLGTGEQEFESTGDTITLAASSRYFLVATVDGDWRSRRPENGVRPMGRNRNTVGASRTPDVIRLTAGPPGARFSTLAR